MRKMLNGRDVGSGRLWPRGRQSAGRRRRRKALACGAQVCAWHAPLPNLAGSKQPGGAGRSCGV